MTYRTFVRLGVSTSLGYFAIVYLAIHGLEEGGVFRRVGDDYFVEGFAHQFGACPLVCVVR